jgi:hypothetical protein
MAGEHVSISVLAIAVDADGNDVVVLVDDDGKILI